MKSYKRPYKKEELIELEHYLSFEDATDIAIAHISNEVEIQRLWAGYGAVSSFSVSVVAERNSKTVIDMIVKRVNPPMGDLDDVSHMRKVKSYFVEAYFYSKLVPRLNRVWEGNENGDGPPCVPLAFKVEQSMESFGDVCHGSGCVGTPSFRFLMSDLRGKFSASSGWYLSREETMASLTFLAKFHATFWEEVGDDDNVWESGGYWHLQTRLGEYDNISRNEWGSLKAIAHAIDRHLGRSCQKSYGTLVHGDFKEANLLFRAFEDKVECAVVDFQYTGYGFGMKDVVMLFVSSISPQLLRDDDSDQELLEFYFLQLRNGIEAVGKELHGYTMKILFLQYELCLVDYVRFMAGWGFWGSNCSYASSRVKSIISEIERMTSQSLSNLPEEKLDELISSRFPFDQS